MASNSITLDEIEFLLKEAFHDLRSDGVRGFAINENSPYYLEVPTGQLFSDPTVQLAADVGSLKDDLEFLRTDIERKSLSSVYNLVHLITILRLVFEKRDEFKY